jgi:hypothetical protein
MNSQEESKVNNFDIAKDAICPTHGNVGGCSLVITREDRKYQLCMVCMAEKLVEIGVGQVYFVETEPDWSLPEGCEWIESAQPGDGERVRICQNGEMWFTKNNRFYRCFGDNK